MSSNQINSTTNRVMTKTVSSSLQNFQLMNGLTTIVNDNAKMSDLLLDDDDSDTQTLLASTKTIMDYAIARGLATITVSDETSLGAGDGSVKFNYNQYYANTPSTTDSITLYQIDLSYFYVYDATAENDYTPKTNAVLYNSGAITNAAYIAEVNDVIASKGQCLNLIADIMATL